MEERIKALESLARTLEPGAEERAYLQRKVFEYAESFLNDLPNLPAYQATQDKGAGLYDAPISEEPDDIDTLLNLLRQNVDRPGVNPPSAGHMAFIPGGGLSQAALGDYLGAVTSRYAGLFFSAPGAVRMERMLLRWMAGFVGYPQEAAGDLTSGGSIANLVGIVTARDASGLLAKDFHRAVVYLTQQTHHSVDKALRIAGLNECIKRYLPLDEHYRLRPGALDNAVRADRKAGLKPWLVIATAGTTDTGAVDPLEAVAQIAQQHELWLHVDGAYGAAFALCEQGKQKLNGIEHSDSLVVDPHKGLFLPFGSGAALVKDGQKLRASHYYAASYMPDSVTDEEVSPADVSPELSRPFRALRLWLPLKLAGVAPFRAALEEKLLLAQYFYEKMQSAAGFELGPFPDLSIVTFRYLPKRGDANAFNQELVAAIQRDGRIFLSPTTIDGKFILRLAVLGLRTHLATVNLAIEILQEKASALEG